MTFEHVALLQRFPLHAAAIDRHVTWALASAAVGDQDLAENEMADVLAIVAEVATPHAGP